MSSGGDQLEYRASHSFPSNFATCLGRGAVFRFFAGCLERGAGFVTFCGMSRARRCVQDSSQDVSCEVLVLSLSAVCLGRDWRFGCLRPVASSCTSGPPSISDAAHVCGCGRTVMAQFVSSNYANRCDHLENELQGRSSRTSGLAFVSIKLCHMSRARRCVQDSSQDVSSEVLVL